MTTNGGVLHDAVDYLCGVLCRLNQLFLLNSWFVLFTHLFFFFFLDLLKVANQQGDELVGLFFLLLVVDLTELFANRVALNDFPYRFFPDVVLFGWALSCAFSLQEFYGFLVKSFFNQEVREILAMALVLSGLCLLHLVLGGVLDLLGLHDELILEEMTIVGLVVVKGVYPLEFLDGRLFLDIKQAFEVLALLH